MEYIIGVVVITLTVFALRPMIRRTREMKKTSDTLKKVSDDIKKDAEKYNYPK